MEPEGRNWKTPGALMPDAEKPIEISSLMAEGVGFEPTRDLATPGGFQDRCLKPLGHPSKLYLSGLISLPLPANIGFCYRVATLFLRAAANASSIFAAAPVSIPSMTCE